MLGRQWQLIIATVTATLSSASPGHAADDNFATHVKPVLAKYCFGCHGPEKQKGDRRLDQLMPTFTDAATAEHWQDVLDQFNLGEMPPDDEPQPTTEQRLALVNWLTAKLQQARETTAASQPPAMLRRLTNTEYRYTIRDLLHLNIDVFDPAEGLPDASPESGFDNSAGELSTSAGLLKEYLAAAERIVDKAVAAPEKPQVKKWIMPADQMRPGSRDVFTYRNGLKDGTPPCCDITSGVPATSRCYSRALRDGVPHDGEYVIRVTAQAVHRKARKRNATADPVMRMSIIASDGGKTPAASDRIVKIFEASDDIQTYEVRTWLDKGFSPVVMYQNGASAGRGLIARQIAKDRGINSKLFDERIVTKEAEHWVGEYYKGPRIRVFKMEIEGPFISKWPPASHTAIFGENGSAKRDPKTAALLVHDFAGRAYRRPVSDDELRPITTLVTEKMAGGVPFEDAVRLGVKTVLVSPGFVYIAREHDQLNDYALAARLSYFLWSSMPDETLLELAAQRRLHDPAIRRQQAIRMLADAKARGFVENFSNQWLELRRLGKMPPDENRFRHYYREDLASAMKRETYSFVGHILEKNLSVRTFIDSDFSFMNGALARHYGIGGVEGESFRKVKLPADSVRGGVMTHGSVLTATSNGVDTSPVVRGVWLLESVLGTPPSPPPPDVEPLAPDIRGATTIRDQLRKHREIETCNACHRKIDPYGFALENFDPVGKWRSNYRGGRRIDTTGQTVGGHQFADIRELKAVLTDRRLLVAENLAEHLMSYACARPLTFRDRPAVERVLAAAGESEFGFRDLILEVVADDVFSVR
jgi:hypothetical protein